MERDGQRARGRWRRAAAWGVLALALGASGGGCVSWRGRGGDASRRIALRSAPELRETGGRADRAVLEAFFRASGVPVGDETLAEMIPDGTPEGGLREATLRRVAREGGRVALGIRADEAGLEESLRKGRVLLVVLPEERGWGGEHPLCIPVAWDRKAKALEVLGGKGVAVVGEESFFGRRERLGHAALWLCRPGDAERLADLGRTQRLALADYWFGKGEYGKAERFFGSAAETDSPQDARGLTGQADCLAQRGKIREAVPLYHRVLERNPDDARAMNNLAHALSRDGGDLEEALRLAVAATTRAPENPVYLETEGSIRLAMGDGLAAAECLERAWGHAQGRAAAVQVPIMDQLARAWMAAGRPEMARQVVEARVRAFPGIRFPRDLRRVFPDAGRRPRKGKRRQFPKVFRSGGLQTA